MFHSVHGDWPPPQVGVYYRWYRWLTEVALQGKKFILVNMDETGVGVSETTKRGWYTTERLELRSDTQRVTKQLNTDYTHMKTSLLGVICNDPTIQPHLPQFLLPKFRKKDNPPGYILDLYEAMGYPLVLQHGTTGWNDEETMKNFLVELRRVVYAKDPELWTVLILDCCRTHVSRKMPRMGKASA